MTQQQVINHLNAAIQGIGEDPIAQILTIARNRLAKKYGMAEFTSEPIPLCYSRGNIAIVVLTDSNHTGQLAYDIYKHNMDGWKHWASRSIPYASVEMIPDPYEWCLEQACREHNLSF